MKSVTDFADAIDFDRRYAWVLRLAEAPIINMMTNLHSAHITVTDAIDLVMAETMAFVIEHAQESGLLSDVKNKARYSVFVERLKTSIESLPRTYIIRIEIPEFSARWPGRVRVSEDIDLVTGTVMPSALLARPQGDGLIEQPKAGRVSFWEFRVRGYASEKTHSAGVADCLTQAKLLAFNLARAGLFFRTVRAMEFSASITSELTGETKDFPLPHALRECLGTIAPRQENLFSYDGLLDQTGLDELTATDQRRLLESRREMAALTHSFAPVVDFFKMRSHPDFVNICAAIEWYEDSRSAENQTFAYLAACIGLEAVLGSDETLTGISKRLADRYAFLLGRGRTQREELAQQYATVLNVRGKLVHAKAARLTSAESQQLFIARQMLERVIAHEISSMLND